MGRYLGIIQGPSFVQKVSFTGLLCGKLCWIGAAADPLANPRGHHWLGAIACPPALLGMDQAKPEDRLHLIHYEKDELCNWKPGKTQLDQSSSTHTYVMGGGPAYKGHFGPSEHCYSHWLALSLPQGTVQFSTLLFVKPEAAAKAKRDATPLRLISWLSYKLSPELEKIH